MILFSTIFYKKVYNLLTSCYNVGVKNLTKLSTTILYTTACLTTAVCMTASTLVSNGATKAVYAEQSTDFTLPEDLYSPLQMSALTDFAYDGEQLYYADGNTLYTLADGTKSSLYTNEGGKITHIDLQDGELYFSAYAVGSTSEYTFRYTLSSGDVYPTNYTFANATEVGDYYFKDNDLKYVDKSSDTFYTITCPDEWVKNLKTFNGEVYAYTATTIYTLSATTATPVNMTFYDEGKVGELPADLMAVALHDQTAWQTATVTQDSYMVQFLGTEKKIYTANEQMSALYLGQYGNATLIARKVDGNYQTFLILTDKVSLSLNVLANEVENRLYLHTATGLYRIPYMHEETKIKTLDKDTVIVATRAINDSTLLQTDLIYVICQDGSTGYVAKSFLSEFPFNSDNGSFDTQEPEDYSEKNDLQTLALVLLLIAIILIAGFYMVFIGTYKKKEATDDQTYFGNPTPNDNQTYYGTPSATNATNGYQNEGTYPPTPTPYGEGRFTPPYGNDPYKNAYTPNSPYGDSGEPYNSTMPKGRGFDDNGSYTTPDDKPNDKPKGFFGKRK